MSYGTCTSSVGLWAFALEKATQPLLRTVETIVSVYRTSFNVGTVLSSPQVTPVGIDGAVQKIHQVNLFCTEPADAFGRTPASASAEAHASVCSPSSLAVARHPPGSTNTRPSQNTQQYSAVQRGTLLGLRGRGVETGKLELKSAAGDLQRRPIHGLHLLFNGGEEETIDNELLG